MLEKVFLNLSRFSILAILGVLACIFVVLVYKAYPAMDKFGLQFLFSSTWDPQNGIFGGLASIYGTIVSTGIAMILAIPVALGIAVFLTQIAPNPIRNFFSSAIELLAAIPSIVYGMWGFIYFVPLVRGVFGGSGFGLLTGALVLAIMILPFITSISRDAMDQTPEFLKESAYALGATKLDTTRDIIFAYAKTGIVGAVILALGRALAETMAVAFLLGGISRIGGIVEPSTSIPVTLATQFGEAMGDEIYESSLFYLALILFVISFFSIAIAKFVFLKRRSLK